MDLKSFYKLVLIVIAGVLVLGGVSVFRYFFPPPPPKVVAMIMPIIPVTDLTREGFKEGMKELGYSEGRDIVYEEAVFLPPERGKMQEAFQDAINRDVDVVYTLATTFTELLYKEMQSAQKNIPILFSVGDLGLVELGIVKDLRAPGNGVTGVMSDMPETVGRQLEFLRLISPEAKKLGVLSDGFMIPKGLPGPFFLAELRRQVPLFGFTLVEYKTSTSPGPLLETEAKKILSNIKAGDVDAFIHMPGHFVQPQQVYEAQMAKRVGIPTLMPVPDEVAPHTGGLLAYGEDDISVGKQIAVMADKIFKGANPAEMPIEFPRVFGLAINLQTARDIGIVIPESLLSIADILFEQ